MKNNLIFQSFVTNYRRFFPYGNIYSIQKSVAREQTFLLVKIIGLPSDKKVISLGFFVSGFNLRKEI